MNAKNLEERRRKKLKIILSGYQDKLVKLQEKIIADEEAEADTEIILDTCKEIITVQSNIITELVAFYLD